MLRKLSRISFNFAKATEKSPAEAKITELFGQTSQTDKQTKMEIERNIVKKAREVAQYNQKIRNYHFYEYKRGEDFIENIPTNPDFAYNPKDLQAEEAEKERITVQQLRPIPNHEQRAKILRQKIGAYHDKQKKYQIEQFQRYLDEYPGTVKGPRPEDDIEAFRAYAFKKMPKIMIDEMAHQKYLKEQIDQGRNQSQEIKQEQMPDPPLVSAPINITEFFGKDRDNFDPKNCSLEQKQNYCIAIQRSYTNETMFQDYKMEVPLIPTTNFFNYQHFVRHWMGWSHFRNSYTRYNLQKTIKELQEKMERVTNSLLEAEGNEWIDLPANIPSLSRYYNCLPKQLQEHPGMKDIYLGLEYSSPDFSYDEKEDAINQTCLQLLPFDQVSTKILKDYTARSRLFATPYIHEKIQTISPEFTWDLQKFFDELKKQELRGETSNQNKDLRYPEPPEVHKMWEQGTANLPVDYYENDDGFWDGIISEKLKRYDEYKPMLKTRKHFVH